MDQISPAVSTCLTVETSSWNRSRSQSPATGCEVVPTASLGSSCTTITTPEADPTSSSTNQPCDSFSNVIKAATVALLNGESPPTQDPQEESSSVLHEDEYSAEEMPNIEEKESISDIEHKSKKPRIETEVAEGFVEHSGPTSTHNIHKEPTMVAESQESTISVALEGDDLWQQFHHVGTEMIITKTGRRMFPSIVVSVAGLDPDCKYNISLEVNLADDNRYKFVNAEWAAVGKAEAHDEDMLVYNHQDSPSTGKHWMNNKVSFKKIKLSNNRNNKRGQVVALNSMHKYLPRVIISRFISKKKSSIVHTHPLEQCSFVAVTAYQNDLVTQLKIDYNPFAKAFRDSPTETEMYGCGGMMGTWPPLSPLLSPYGTTYCGDCPGSQQLLSPASLQPSPLPQFNAAFANWESPPYSPSFRQQTANTAIQQQLLVSSGYQQQKVSPLPRFNSVFNNWDAQATNSVPLSSYTAISHHPQRSAFVVPRLESQISFQSSVNPNNQ